MPALWDDRRRARRDGRAPAPRSFEVLVPPPADGVDARPARPADAAPRRRRDAAVHARRHERDGQGAPPRRGRGDAGAIDRPRQHLPPVPAAGPRAHPSASAGSTRSWAGTGRSSPTRAASRSCSLGDLRVIDDDGVTFKQPPRRARPTGSRRSTRSRSRRRSGPDIAVAFDQPVFPSSPRGGRRGRDAPDPPLGGAVARGAHARRTRRCSGSSRAGWTRSCARSRRGSSRRCRSTASTSAASPATRRRSERNATLDVTVPLLDGDPRPRYLMGLGSPLDLLEAVHRGVDLFDSVLPARVARNGQLWVPGGRLNLRNAALSWTTRDPSRRTVRARSAPGSRGPIWPTCSGPRRCSRTVSRLVTT